MDDNHHPLERMDDDHLMTFSIREKSLLKIPYYLQDTAEEALVSVKWNKDLGGWKLIRDRLTRTVNISIDGVVKQSNHDSHRNPCELFAHFRSSQDTN
ncbi:hypothetical protein J6590_057264 [Homalodisca vitripennis]|nr:hypothetical protein J6590_057264 [Homalodisca vitripennis]